MNTPDLLNVWDVLRIFVTLATIALVVGGATVLMRPLPDTPAVVERARILLIVGVLLLLVSTTIGRVQNFGAPVTPQLLLSTAAAVVLLVWLVREFRATRAHP